MRLAENADGEGDASVGGLLRKIVSYEETSLCSSNLSGIGAPKYAQEKANCASSVCAVVGREGVVS